MRNQNLQSVTLLCVHVIFTLPRSSVHKSLRCWHRTRWHFVGCTIQGPSPFPLLSSAVYLSEKHNHVRVYETLDVHRRKEKRIHGPHTYSLSGIHFFPLLDIRDACSSVSFCPLKMNKALSDRRWYSNPFLFRTGAISSLRGVSRESMDCDITGDGKFFATLEVSVTRPSTESLCSPNTAVRRYSRIYSLGLALHAIHDHWRNWVEYLKIK